MAIKYQIFALFVATTIAMATASAPGQEPPGEPPPPGDFEGPGGPPGPPPRGPGGPMMHPLFTALDRDHDGIISAKEIERSAKSLARLDKNEDGEISHEELRPRGGPPGGFGGFPGFGPGPEGGPEGGPGDERRPFRRNGSSGRGFANRGGSPEMIIERMLQKNDIDGDGMLSSEEVPERAMRLAEQSDANEDGLLDKDELVEGLRTMQERVRQEEGWRGGDRPNFPRDRKKNRPRRERPESD
ncbi:MAG TPA: hypothetical protein VIY86_14110, partial [Pirellulaceae bacterium]